MTPARFRKLALGLPESVEGEHMNHADFRVRDKIFASLGPKEDWGMIKLPRDRQVALLREEPGVFEAFAGDWGRYGATRVWLEAAPESTVRDALMTAWRHVAPKRLVGAHDQKARPRSPETARKSSKVQCRTPTPGKQPTRIDKWKYDLVKAAILKIVPPREPGVEFRRLSKLVERELATAERKRLGSVSWYTTTVKLELEVQGVIERISGARPQRLVRKG